MNSISSNVRPVQAAPVAFNARQPQVYATQPQEQPNDEKSKKLKKTLIALGAIGAAGIAIGCVVHNVRKGKNPVTPSAGAASSPGAATAAPTRADKVKELTGLDPSSKAHQALTQDAQAMQKVATDPTRGVAVSANSALTEAQGFASEFNGAWAGGNLKEGFERLEMPKGIGANKQIIRNTQTGATALFDGTTLKTVKHNGDKFIYGAQSETAVLRGYQHTGDVRSCAQRIQSNGNVYYDVTSKAKEKFKFDGADIEKFGEKFEFKENDIHKIFGNLSRYTANGVADKKPSLVYEFENNNCKSITTCTDSFDKKGKIAGKVEHTYTDGGSKCSTSSYNNAEKLISGPEVKTLENNANEIRYYV